MDLEAQVVAAAVAELQRQAAEGDLTMAEVGPGRLRLDGEVDLEALAAALAGAVAGGP
jgi:hypothetical protein